ncbi:MAG: tRNA guanosine(34) transglycosylase Tgt [Candidatus Woesearchaeota archaeon]
MFKILNEDKSARVGILILNGRKVETPFFMPVATRGVGKYIGSDDYKEINSNAIICNSYILSQNPGIEIIKKFGGIHRFMNYQDVIFSDCGGFQISRESFYVKTIDKGIVFKNLRTNKIELLTPEKAIFIQNAIGSDAIMALDDMQAYGSNKEIFKKALKHTNNWALESLKYHNNNKQAIFGIIQGGFFKDLRLESAQFMTNQDFDGISIGGLAIGEKKEEMYKVLNWTLPIVNKKAKDKPHYLMGVGSPLDVLKCIGKGIDCFDSVYPTKNARHNTLFTWKGKIEINKQKYKNDKNPIDEQCKCLVCKNFTRAYIYYISKIDEPAAKRYKSIHNLFFMQELLRKARIAIKEGEFNKFYKEFSKDYLNDN